MNMFVGSVALATASTLSTPLASEPYQPPTAATARAELRDAVWELGDAYEALKAASQTFSVAWEQWGIWEKKNPRPGAPRVYKKWARRQDRFFDEIGMDEAREAEEAARRRYTGAQERLARVNALDLDEALLKSSASLMYEGGMAESGPQRTRHLRYTNQIVAFSVALDVVRLSTSTQSAIN